jgi:peptidoglycan LD-endopeptidase LytH
VTSAFVLASRLVLAARRPRITRFIAATLLLAAAAVPLVGGRATGQESLSDLKERMSDLQSELDAATERIEELRTQEDELLQRMNGIEVRTRDLERRRARLEKRVVEAAQNLYRQGSADMLEMLLTADSIAELSTRAEVLSRVSTRDTHALIEFGRTEKELAALKEELARRQDDLTETRRLLAAEAESLQGRFDDVSQEYKDLQARLAAQARRARAATVPMGPVPAPSAPVRVSGNMTCPVAGAHSFIDSWGFPRSGGRTHEGTDLMAASGTPVVAVVSGSITYAGYGGSAGNWQILSGDDGNAYWYMHNQQNSVTGGHVSVGQQIAMVGDTGNAAGTPHLHFEYHPGGGGPVNPYPLLVQIC